MKNYLTRKNDADLDFGFWGNPFNDFFKPLFYGEENGTMNTDVRETENGYELSVDMPGFEKENISVTLNGGYLTVEAKREEKDDNKKNYLRRERSFSCSRSYYVGDSVTETDIKAKYNNGTLVVNVPKQEEKQIHTGNIAID